jgi:FSR family fosmidomycin resistance protein-like MFS transporter
LQPFIGFYTDKTEALFLSNRYGVHHFWIGFIIDSNSVLDDTGGSFLVGIGSSIFHPEASRVAFRFWRKRGLAQSIFQLGGNTGSAIGPLLVAIIVAPYGQSNIIWFVLVGILGIFVLTKIAVWYQNHLNLRASKTINEEETVPFSKRKNCNRVLLL